LPREKAIHFPLSNPPYKTIISNNIRGKFATLKIKLSEPNQNIFIPLNLYPFYPQMPQFQIQATLGGGWIV
jgi:hypothetical protein